VTEVVRVLSIDGGGIRGYIPALVLAELERRADRPIASLFDLVVGTSTGGIIAIGAACGLSAKALAEFYPTYGRDIFGGREASWLEKRIFNSGATLAESIGRAARTLGSPFGGNRAFGGNARHRPAGLEGVLRNVLGDYRLSNAQVELAVTSFDGITSLPILFSSADAHSDPTADMLLRDVARATSAAPTYFPPFETTWRGTQCRFVDGGVWANNPSAIAVAEASRIAAGRGLTTDNILLVSLGTGVAPATEGFSGANSWVSAARDTVGVATSVWAGELLSIRALGSDHIVRMQVEDNRIAGAMDDPSKARLQTLESAAARLISEHDEHLTLLADVLNV